MTIRLAQTNTSPAHSHYHVHHQLHNVMRRKMQVRVGLTTEQEKVDAAVIVNTNDATVHSD